MRLRAASVTTTAGQTTLCRLATFNKGERLFTLTA
jgi:hypothetical protein